MNKGFKGLLNSKIKERLRKSAGLRKSTTLGISNIEMPLLQQWKEFVDKEYRKETGVVEEFETLSETHLREPLYLAAPNFPMSPTGWMQMGASWQRAVHGAGHLGIQSRAQRKAKNDSRARLMDKRWRTDKNVKITFCSGYSPSDCKRGAAFVHFLKIGV